MSDIPNPMLHAVQIHPLLVYQSNMLSPLIYDLSTPPSTIVSINPINPNTLLEPATYPPLSRLILVHPLLHEPIQVTPSESLNIADESASNTGTQTREVPYVTVLDVFETLYNHLRRPISIPQYNAVPGEDLHAIVGGSYFERCSRFSDPTVARKREDRKKGRKMGQVEAAKGIRHLDFLLGRNRFLGLSGPSGSTSPEVWELCVG